jgi:hypothetical protein
MFTEEYVKAILTPYLGKELRMRSDLIPFCLETSMESSFQIEFTNFGIKFFLKDNFYIRKDIKFLLNQAILKTGLYPHTYDNLLRDKLGKEEDNIFQNTINKYFEEKFAPQIAFTYFTQIKSIEVNEDEFVINGVKFIVCN